MMSCRTSPSSAHDRRPRVPRLSHRCMTPAAFEARLRVALPPLRLGLRARYLEVRRRDPAAAAAAVVANVERIRAQLARQGSWN